MLPNEMTFKKKKGYDSQSYHLALRYICSRISPAQDKTHPFFVLCEAVAMSLRCLYSFISTLCNRSPLIPESHKLTPKQLRVKVEAAFILFYSCL